MSRWYIGADTGSKALAHYAKGASAKDHKWVTRNLKNGHWVYVYDNRGATVGSNSAGSSTPSMDDELTSRGYKKDSDGVYRKYDSSGNVVDSFNPKGGNYKNPHTISGSVPENWHQTRYQRNAEDEARRASAANRVNQQSSMNSQAENERRKIQEMANRRAAENRAQSTGNSMSSQEATARSSKYNAIKRGEQEAIAKRSPNLARVMQEKADRDAIAKRSPSLDRVKQETAERSAKGSSSLARVMRETSERKAAKEQAEKRAQDTNNSMSSQEATARSSKYSAVKRGNESEHIKRTQDTTDSMKRQAATAEQAARERKWIMERIKKKGSKGLTEREYAMAEKYLGPKWLSSSGNHHF